MGEGSDRGNHRSLKAAREIGKLETAAGTELKREKGERRKEKGEGLNSIKDCKQGEHRV